MRKNISGTVLILLLISMLTPAFAIQTVKTLAGPSESPWPMFRHDPQRTGKSQYAGPETFSVKWTYDAGGPVYSPVIGSDGTIYVHSGSNNLYAISPEGSFKWSVKVVGAYSSPAIGADGTIYFGSYDKNFYALSSAGTVKWRYQTGGYIYSSAAVGTDGTIYFGSYDGYFYALNADGTLKWRYSTGRTVDTSPAIASDGTIYVFSVGSAVYQPAILYALSPVGTLNWSYEIPMGVLDVSSPAISSEGTIYFGSFDGKLYAINPSGTLKWNYQTEDDVCSSPALGFDGDVYFGSTDKRFYSLNANGSLKWRFLTGDVIYSSAAVGANGAIYFGSHDGYVYALNSSGSLKWKYKTGNWVDSSPAIGADGTLYMGSVDGKLYAFGPMPTAKTIYIDDDFVDDPANHRWDTIQKGINDADNGDKIIVRDGTYTKAVIVNKHNLTIISESGASTTVVKGVMIENSSFVTFSGFTANILGYPSIVLMNTDYCNVTDNIITNEAYALFLDSSKNNLIRSNKILGNWSINLIDNSSNNTITQNEITGHNMGIFLQGSYSNIIFKNQIYNSQAAVFANPNSSAIIYLNNFINNTGIEDTGYNTDVIFSSREKITYTHNGKTSESYLGNYWSEYSGVDADGNGIGDEPYTPYSVYKVVKDSYPLMKPFENYTIQAPASDFSIAASPTSLSIQQGSLGTSIITITSLSGFNETVQLSISGTPSSVTAIFNSLQVTPQPDGGTNATLTVSVAPIATPGNYTLTITGTNGTLIHNATVSLEIEAAPPTPTPTPTSTPTPTPSPTPSPTVKPTPPSPYIDSLNPSSGAPGTQLTINGKDFGYKDLSPSYWVMFGKSLGHTISWTDTKIVVEAPSDYGTGENDRKFLHWLIKLAIYGYTLDFPSLIRDIIEEFLSSDVEIPPSESKIQVTVRVHTPVGYSNTELFTYNVDEFIQADLLSPGELRVFDSQERVTGVVNGQVMEEIPTSYCANNSILIMSPYDSYRYKVVGTGEGTYGLKVVHGEFQEVTTFTVTGIPTCSNATHQYTVDWTALSRGEGGVAVQIDSDGDGRFEKTFTAGSQLTRDEFMRQVAPAETFPLWIVGTAIAAISIPSVAISFFWRKRKQRLTNR